MSEKMCSGCDAKTDALTMPYIVHESAMGRNERIFKRLLAVIILLVVLLVGTNVAWLVYESQFVVEEVDVWQTNDGGQNSFIGNDGDIVYGDATY